MIIGITVEGEGQAHFDAWKDKIAEAAERRHGKMEDFCIFVRDSGFAIMTPERYARYSKADKKRIEKWYDYRQYAERDEFNGDQN